MLGMKSPLMNKKTVCKDRYKTQITLQYYKISKTQKSIFLYLYVIQQGVEDSVLPCIIDHLLHKVLTVPVV